MKKALIIIGIIILALVVFLFSTGKINLKPAGKSADKAADEILKPVTEPIKAKETTQEKLKSIEQQLEEQNQKLLDDMDAYK